MSTPPPPPAQPRTSVDLAALHQGLATAVKQVDRQMSPWKRDSDLMLLNRAPVDTWVALPAELLEVLACALDIYRPSAGVFDPGVGALVDAWGFGAVRDAPDAAAIHDARQATQCPTHASLALDQAAGRALKRAPLQLDLCGIADGYAVDRMVAVLQQNGVHHALAALDGELRAMGNQACGDRWAVALERPEAGRRARKQHRGVGRRAGKQLHAHRRLGHCLARGRPRRRPGPGAAHGAGRTVFAAPC